MRSILLVAMREYRQIASTRGFWVMLLVLPVVIGITQFAGRYFRPQTNSAYVMVDSTGLYAEPIEKRLVLNRERGFLIDLSGFAQRWGADKAKPDAIWAQGRSWFTDAEVETFIGAGGIEKAVAEVTPLLPKDAPKYEITPRATMRADLPADVVTGKGAEALGVSLAHYLQGDIKTSDGKRPLSLAVYIPANLGAPGTAVQMWTNGRPNEVLIETIRSEITRIQRSRALQASGLPPEIATQISTITTPVNVSAPPQGSGREQVLIRSALPLAMVYLLLVTVMVTGSMMLQGVIEEKSNKLLESVLACIRPADLMYGKLLGLGAVGLTILAVWVGAAVGASLAVQGLVADIVRPSLAALDEPWIIFAMLFYFLAGYLIISMLYLAIGALANSLQDAQSYLMPVVMIIMLPVVFMIVAVISTPNGFLPVLLSWIPLYTPFAMLARLGAGVSLMEVLGTGAMLTVFVIVEMLLLGRLFQASLLRTGQPPKLGGFIAMMFGKSTEA